MDGDFMRDRPGETGDADTTQLEKFQHPDITADGSRRAAVAFDQLETLWINTGTLCNVECAHCYIESSPTNDRLTYLSASEAAPFIADAAEMGAAEVGFTGGEPFMNPALPEMVRHTLEKGMSALVLTNAMRPMMRPRIMEALLALKTEFNARLKLRVSLDHYTPEGHDRERGAGSFASSMTGLRWLTENGFSVNVATRMLSGENNNEIRTGFATLFAAEALSLDALDTNDLIVFPEMDEAADVPEITTECWDMLGKDPSEPMCASSRMIVKRRGAARATVTACTLIPYDTRFDLGATLKDAARPVKLNHPYCATFCVLGGASCSG